jgi:hypothetical protein
MGLTIESFSSHTHTQISNITALRLRESIMVLANGLRLQNNATVIKLNNLLFLPAQFGNRLAGEPKMRFDKCRRG